MQRYEDLIMKIILFTEQDAIRTSGESADDFGEWNDNWFSKNNAN